MKTLFLNLFLLIFICCIYDPPTGGLDIENNSKSNVYVYATCFDEISCEDKLVYKDNFGENAYDANGNKMNKSFYPNYRIKKDSVRGIAIGGTPKKPKTECDDEKLKLFFIEEKTMKENTWEEICENKLYVKKVVLSQKELDRIKWKYVYIK